jgi:isopropylmalate/homocitrate/citramalate synthase
MDRKQSLEMAVKCTKYARSITKDDPAQADSLLGALQGIDCATDEILPAGSQDLQGDIIGCELATSPCFRRIIFNMDRKQSLEMAVKCTKYARSITSLRGRCGG